MIRVASVCRCLIWIGLVVWTLVQVPAVIGIYELDMVIAILLLASTVVLWAATILFFALRNAPLFGLLGSGIAAVGFIAATVMLSGYTTPGTNLSVMDILLRHTTPVLMLPLMAAVVAGRRAEESLSMISAIQNGKNGAPVHRTLTGKVKVKPQHVSIYDESPDSSE